MRKKICVFILVVISVFVCVFGLAACGSKNKNNNHSDIEQGGNNSNIDNPGTDNPNFSKYSSILQTVLTSEYYNKLTEDYFNNTNRLSNKYSPIPYSFLEKQGHDINSIKNDELDCTVEPFLKDGDNKTFYMSVIVENKNNLGNYYSDYVLSYNLTEKEYSDLYTLHHGNYFQARTFIQEMDNVKTAKINSCVNIDITTYIKLTDQFNNSSLVDKVFDDKSVTFDVVNVPDKNHMSIMFRSTPSSSSSIMISTGKIAYMDYLVYNEKGPSFDNDIFKIKTIDKTSYTPTNSEEFLNSSENITYYKASIYINVNNFK